MLMRFRAPPCATRVFEIRSVCVQTKSKKRFACCADFLRTTCCSQRAALVRKPSQERISHADAFLCAPLCRQAVRSAPRW